MYLPKLFATEDRALLIELMQRNSFATVIAQSGGELEISHLPLLVLEGEPLRLQGHLAKQNPLARIIERGEPLTVVFHGPHAYVSPRLYENAANVPTWNYAVVHAHGHPRVLDPETVLPHLRALISTFESSAETPWKMEDAGGLAPKLVPGIVAYEIQIEKLEGKLKLNQNRVAEDWRGVLKTFEASASPDERAVAALMKRTAPKGY